MPEEANIRTELAARIQHLPAEQIKRAVLQWLGTEEGDLMDLEQTLTQDTHQPQMVYGTVDHHNTFVPLTDEEMIAQSLESLEEYQQSGHSIPATTMESWVDSLDSDNPLPCPQ